MSPSDPHPKDDDLPAMANRIPEERRDRVFFYATEVRCDSTGAWEVRIDPDDCLTGYDDARDAGPSIEAIADRSLTTETDGDATVYDGPVLLSAGVILAVEDDFVLFKRDQDAPVDPLMWTSPAGRCDTTPSRTALVELYEELLAFADEQPAIVAPPDDVPLTELYEETLRQNGVHSSCKEWVQLEAVVPGRFDDLHAPVTTIYGGEETNGEFWPYLDVENSTLELRKVYQIQPPDTVSTLRFDDAEFDRRTALLSEADLNEMDAGDLVPTNRAFRDRVLEGG